MQWPARKQSPSIAPSQSNSNPERECSHNNGKSYTSSPSSLRAALLGPWVLFAELLISRIRGCGVLALVVGGADVSFWDPDSSSSPSSGCSCNSCSYSLMKNSCPSC